MPRMRHAKTRFRQLLEAPDWRAHLPEVAGEGLSAVGPLLSFLLLSPCLRHRAAVALGAVVAGLEREQPEAVRNIMRRLMWHMNEESGNIGWGIPEAYLCEEIRGRGQHTYIIFITANDKESDMLKGYEAGGADYVTKPFSVTVLCKKVAAVFANLELRTPRHDLFDDGFLKIDFSEQRASLGGEPLDFTPKEYRTLFLFVKNPRIILTKRQILEKLWDIDGDFVDEHTLTTIISRIRKKIETDEHKYIKTAYGMGYQWIGGEQA